MKQPTAKLAELVSKLPAAKGLQHMNEHILLLGGGLPIEIGGEVVGALAAAAHQEAIEMQPAHNPG